MKIPFETIMKRKHVLRVCSIFMMWIMISSASVSEVIKVEISVLSLADISK